jgi:hypothetical protein
LNVVLHVLHFNSVEVLTLKIHYEPSPCKPIITTNHNCVWVARNAVGGEITEDAVRCQRPVPATFA